MSIDMTLIKVNGVNRYGYDASSMKASVIGNLNLFIRMYSIKVQEGMFKVPVGLFEDNKWTWLKEVLSEVPLKHVSSVMKGGIELWVYVDSSSATLQRLVELEVERQLPGAVRQFITDNLSLSIEYGMDYPDTISLDLDGMPVGNSVNIND